MYYDFKCTKCNKEEEIEIPIAEYDNQKDKITCPDCGAPMKRVLQFSGGIEFKGPGFYNTEYGVTAKWQ